MGKHEKVCAMLCNFSIILPCYSFLAKRGVKEEIMSFNARKISPEIRDSVQELLDKNKKSFDPAVRLAYVFIISCLYIRVYVYLFVYVGMYAFTYECNYTCVHI